jgi:purine-binding chemotaxis protein CheW
LVFRSSGLNCTFPLEAVREIVPMARLSTPPGLRSALTGFLDLRGTAIPIIRLDRLSNLPEQLLGMHTPTIILRGVLGPIGILVERVRGIVPMPSVVLVEIPRERTFHGCAIASVQLDGELIHVLSPDALLGSMKLGLPISYGIVQEHGGSIEVQSEEGVGTEFVVNIPLHLESHRKN